MTAAEPVEVRWRCKRCCAIIVECGKNATTTTPDGRVLAGVNECPASNPGTSHDLELADDE